LDVLDNVTFELNSQRLFVTAEIVSNSNPHAFAIRVKCVQGDFWRYAG